MKKTPLLIFFLFFMNVNSTILLSCYITWKLVLVLMFLMTTGAIFFVKRKQLKTLLLLQAKVDSQIDDDDLIKQVSKIFMAILIGIPGFFTSVLSLFLLVPKWQKPLTLNILKALHL